MKKFKLSMMIIVAAALLISGCAKNRAATSEETANQKPALDVWIFFDYNTPGTHYLDLWAELEKSFDCQLNVQTYVTEELRDKLRIALACDELPDIFAVWGGSFPEFLFDADACLPVQDYIDNSDNHYKDSYYSKYRDGNTYIIPCLVEAYAVNYGNKALMEKIGVSMPESWEDLITLVDKVNAFNKANGTAYAPIGFGNKDAWLGELMYTMIVNRMDPYALDKLIRSEIDFNDAIFKDAAQKIIELNEHNAFAEDFLQTGEVESVENFVHNSAVLMPHQSTIIYYLLENMGEDAIEVAQFPDCSYGRYGDASQYLMNANHNMTPGLCINKKTRYAGEAAKICLEFSRRVNEINVSQYGYLNFMEDTSIQPPSNLPEPIRSFRAMVKNSKKMTSFWYGVLPKEDADTWRNITLKLYAGALSPDEFIQQGKRCLNFDIY